MKATELRIGNYLLRDGVLVTIDSRSIFDMWKNDPKEYGYAPIPINERRLLQLGAKKNETILVDYFNFYSKRNTEITLMFCNDKGQGEYYVMLKQEEDVISIPMRMFFVHQWQNLYFALTGEELKLRPTAA